MSKHIYKKNGFTIVELLIAASISISTFAVAFSLIQIALKGNRIQENQLGLKGRINDALDFIVDDVNKGNRIIDDEDDIKEENINCSFPDQNGESFLFGISLPDQALVKDDYIPDGSFNLYQVECPITYTLRPSKFNEKKSFILERFGPRFNSKGYFISTAYEEYKSSTILDGISSGTNYLKIECPEIDEGWNPLKTVQGISFCTDKNNKSIQLQIEAKDLQKGLENNPSNVISSITAFSRIQDDRQIRTLPSLTSESEAPKCFGSYCCWLGACLKSNKITYMIDKSYSMNKDYEQHPNGVIMNGQWTEISPSRISPIINGNYLLDSAKITLKQAINKLPTSDLVASGREIYLQVIAFDNSSEYLFPSGPQELTRDNKSLAIAFINSLSPDIQKSNPWDGLCSSLEEDKVGQVILLTDGTPNEDGSPDNLEGGCVGEDGNYAEIIEDYNLNVRSQTPTGSLIIDTISYFHNFCERRTNYRNSNWLGLISNGAESECVHIK